MPGGDKVIAQAHSAELSKLGWKLGKKNLPAAYLTGLLAAKRLREDANQKEIVPYCDVRPFVHGSRVAAAIKGLKDGGAAILSDDAVFPSEERLRGAHMSSAEDSSRKRGERGSVGPKEVHPKADTMEYEKQFEAVKSKILNLDHKEEKRKRKR
jgi:large subunit ribosomal protein L18